MIRARPHHAITPVPGRAMVRPSIALGKRRGVLGNARRSSHRGEYRVRHLRESGIVAAHGTFHRHHDHDILPGHDDDHLASGTVRGEDAARPVRPPEPSILPNGRLPGPHRLIQHGLGPAFGQDAPVPPEAVGQVPVPDPRHVAGMPSSMVSRTAESMPCASGVEISQYGSGQTDWPPAAFGGAPSARHASAPRAVSSSAVHPM
jgi:hypothetical protein